MTNYQHTHAGLLIDALQEIEEGHPELRYLTQEAAAHLARIITAMPNAVAVNIGAGTN
jgi:hypothetical protein